MDLSKYPPGWPGLVQTEEDKLAATQAASDFDYLYGYKAPDEIDHRSWLKIEDQLKTSSCGGHMGSSGCEVLNWVETEGGVIQLSRWQAYISAQKENNLVGKDGGCTINGAVKALAARGICVESLAPFTGEYYTNISSEAWKDAEKRQILKHSVIKSSQEAINWIGTGRGVVFVGVPCGNLMFSTNGWMERVDESGLGHALAVVGYIRKNNKLWLQIPGSWGTAYADNGWLHVTEKAFDRWCQMAATSYRAEVYGVSDMENPEPRPFSFIGYYG